MQWVLIKSFPEATRNMSGKLVYQNDAPLQIYPSLEMLFKVDFQSVLRRLSPELFVSLT